MKLYKALLELEKVCPELFWIMKSTVIEEVKNTPGMTAYACKTRSGYKIGINEEWVRDFDIFNLAAIIEHELLHIVLEHVLDMDKFDDPELANNAQDYIINDIATFFKDKNRLNKHLKAGCFLENLNQRYNQRFNSRDNSSLDIYNFLLKKKEEAGKKNKKLQLDSFDKGMDPSKDEKDAGEEISQEMQDMMEGLAIAKMGGEIPKDKGDKKDGDVKVEKGEIDPEQKVVGQQNIEVPASGLEGVLDSDQIKEILKVYSKSCSDLKHYFENIEKMAKNKKIKEAIERFFNSNKEFFKKSIKKLNKRFSFIPYGRIADRKQKALVALDVSGSMMNEEDLKKLKMAVSSATGNGFMVDLIFGDTRKLGEFKDIKPNFDFKKIFGGGGTDLRFIFKESIKDYDVVVVVTDGCFDHDDVPTKMRDRILFLITSSVWGNQTVPGFKNIII